MKINIVPQTSITFLTTQDIEKFIIISIAHNRDYVFSFVPKNNFIDYLEMDFDDITYEYFSLYKDDPNRHLNVFTEIHAKQIYDFIKKYKDSIDKIIIHCTAGISRSAGIGKAVAEWLNGTDKDVIYEYHEPNDLCYDVMASTINKMESKKN